MRFYPGQHTWYCGIDLHARTMYLGILNQDGDMVGHRHRTAGPAALLQGIALDREDLVVAVACLFTCSWLAALGPSAGIPVVLGHALELKAIHGGTAQHDQLDAHTIAVWLRGGMRPQASV
jgi:hypothetical protein